MGCLDYCKVFDKISQDYFMDQIVNVSRRILLWDRIITNETSPQIPIFMTNDSADLQAFSRGMPQVPSFCYIFPHDMYGDLEGRPIK